MALPRVGQPARSLPVMPGRGLHSFPFPLNLSLPCPLPLDLSSLYPPYNPINRRMCQEGAQVQLLRERCVPEGPQVEL